MVGLGVKDLIALETDDAILIANKEFSQEIKDLVNEMKSCGMDEATNHKKGTDHKYLSTCQGKKLAS